MKKGVRNALIGAGLTLGAGVACAVSGKWLVDIYLHRKNITEFTTDKSVLSPENVEALNNNSEIPKGSEFYKSTPHMKLTIKNRANENINALFYKNPSGSNVYVIYCHGYNASAQDNSHMAMHHYEMGYNVLMPHMRAHKGSDHKYCTMGWLERLDLIDWARFIAATNKDCKIVLHGLSMGAGTVMMATGEKLPENVVCAIEDCGYTSVYDEYRAQIWNVAHLPPFPSLAIFRSLAKRIAGFDIKEASAVEAVKKSKTPTLFIHGDADTFVPFWMLDVVYESAACEKEKIVFAGADHATSATKYPELYWESVKTFIEKYI